MAHMFFFKREDLPRLDKLISRSIDGEYIVLNEMSGGWVDIIQWDEYYQNAKFIVLKRDQLDEKKRLW